MSSSIGQRFADLFRKAAGRIIFSDNMKKRFVESLNKKLDIPVLNEQEEAELIGLVWDTMEETVKEVLEIDN